tara:strand:+ start:309 stop:1514 length:1206 start_codon:yes stop_codon:yes gene_type:complete
MSKEEVVEAPDGTLEQGEFKIKKKPKKLVTEKKVTKVDMAKKEEPKEETKKEENAVQTQESNDSNVIIEEKKNEAGSEKVVENVRSSEEKVKKEETPIIEEVEVKKEDIKETKEVIENIKEEVEEKPQIELPENVEKLIKFMKDTGGTVEDYVNLNKDYTKLNGEQVLKEYYNVSKPHLNAEEVEFLMDDNFAWDEDEDERIIKKKKLAYKEEIAKAKSFLNSSKEKYYEEIKLKPSVSKEQKKANDFFNRYNEEQKVIQQRHENFTNNTKKLFADEFKGFEYNVGDKAFRYNVNNKSDVAQNQSDLNNFVGKFLDKKGEINDYRGYHKALYTANNADKIAQHFYEQGKTDAIRDVNAKSKNITNEVRATSSGEMFINGMKVKAISGVNSSKLKITRKNKT